MKVLTWNIDGFRKSIVSTFNFVIKNIDPDIICLNEVKIKTETFKSLFTNKNYIIFHNPFSPANHHGIATLIKSELFKIFTITEISVKILAEARNDLKVSDIEENLRFQKGRIQQFDFKSIDGSITFQLVNTYFPNSGINQLDKLPYRINIWDKNFYEYVNNINGKVIITGDLNIARNSIDVTCKGRYAGYTDEERKNFSDFLISSSYKDVFRELHPEDIGYTYVGRSKYSKKLRLDYFLSKEMSVKNFDIIYINDIDPKVQIDDDFDHLPILLSW